MQARHAAGQSVDGGHQLLTPCGQRTEQGQTDGFVLLGQDAADGKSSRQPPGGRCMGQGQDAALAVSTDRHRSQTGLVQPLLGLQPVVQQIVKREPHAVRVEAVPDQMQGGHGKARFAQCSQQRPVLKGREHGAGVKQHGSRARIGPELKDQAPAAVPQPMILDCIVAHKRSLPIKRAAYRTTALTNKGRAGNEDFCFLSRPLPRRRFAEESTEEPTYFKCRRNAAHTQGRPGMEHDSSVVDGDSDCMEQTVRYPRWPQA